MATIDSKKLLPPSKESSAIEKPKFLVPVKSISVKKITGSDLKPIDKTGTDEPGSLVVVKKKVVSLSKIINNNLLLDQREASTKRKEEEKSKREKKEKDLEKKVKKNNVKPDLIGSIPGQSIFDKINRFIGFTLLGYLFNQYGELLPKLMEFGKVLEPVGKFVEGFAKNILKGVIDFVEFGYKAYDQTRDFVKQVGGEGAQKTFDEFSKNLNLLLNGAIGAAMLIASTEPKKSNNLSGKGGGYGVGYAAGYAAGLASGKGIRPGAGFRDPGRYRAPGQARAGGFDLEQTRKANTFAPSGQKGPLSGISRGFRGAAAQLETGTLFKRGAGIQKALYNAPGKIKGVMPKGVGKVFGRVPIVGGLLDFAFSLAMGENPGRAAAKAVGATVGSALGTFIPVPFAGTILGGILGDIVGGAMYDTLVGSKQKPQAKAQGGTITGSGQSTVTSSRKLKTRPKKTAPKIQPQKTQPGKDVGGKLRIEQLYGTDEPGKRSALRALKNSSEDVKKMSSINGLTGSMFGAGIDMALGQKPDKKLAKSIGDVFGSVVQNAVNAELSNSFGDISKTIAMANGGVVPTREIGSGLSIGERIGKFISNALTISIESSASKILRNLNRELSLEGETPGAGSGPGGGGGDEGGGGSGGQFTGSAANIPPEGKALLDAIAGSESRGYNSRYPSKTFDNNWVDHPRISEVILSGPNKGKTSDAAGRYQFLSTTWDQYKPAKAFTPENQDIAAYRLAVAAYGYGESGLVKDLKSDPAKVARKLSGTWTSLPGGIEPNDATRGFLSRFEASVKKYRSIGGPLSTKGVKKFSRSDITSFFRQQESFRSKPHEGMDIAAPQGTPISFGMGGEVLGVWRTNSGAREANGGYGTYMDVKFSDGRIARIAHLSNIPSSIRKGSKFRANQIIAYSGGEEGKPGSGRSGGPHIHLEQLSKPMGIEETTKGKYDPLKGGLFDLMQKGGVKISLAPNQPSSTSSAFANDDVSKTDTSITFYNNLVAFQPIEIPTPTV